MTNEVAPRGQRVQEEDRCGICGSGQYTSWECPQCAREIHEADAAALEQARREAIEQFREKAFEPFSALEYISRMRLWQHLQDTAASLSSAPEAGDRYREVRKAFVAGHYFGTSWAAGKERITDAEVRSEALRRWPLPEPGEVPK